MGEARARTREGLEEQVEAEQVLGEGGPPFDWDGFVEPPASRRLHPAELLYAMFERMGGMPSSHWKGKYINMVI